MFGENCMGKCFECLNGLNVFGGNNMFGVDAGMFGENNMFGELRSVAALRLGLMIWIQDSGLTCHLCLGSTSRYHSGLNV